MYQLHARNGAVFSSNGKTPLSFRTLSEEYHDARTSLVLFDASENFRVSLRGPDRSSWFHGMTTQNIRNLPTGSHAPACICSAKGKVLGVGAVDVLEDELVFEALQHSSWLPQLEKLLIMEDVEIVPQEGIFSVSLLGPMLPHFLSSFFSINFQEDIVVYDSTHKAYLRMSMFSGIPRLDLSVYGIDLIEDLSSKIPWIGEHIYHKLRIEAGIPMYGVDITDSNLPQEAGLSRAISFEKGCYVGQETVARLHFRGHVNRQLWLFSSEYPTSSGDIFQVDGQEKGFVTSSTYSPEKGCVLSLGYLRKECFELSSVGLVSAATKEHQLASLLRPASL